uniref:Putative baseplate protein n=1 Tax=viral metagenome TaxID=1070528 RepID=A0A6M3M4A9_9ZZZZ
MAYVAPSIGIAGLTIPIYADILEELIIQKKAIYGEDIYLGVDTTDYQELSVFALMMYDALQTAQYAYNSRSPITAVGSGLDQVVKINGISRQASSHSTVDVEITGTVGITINNGQVIDSNRRVWNLPATVTIPAGGTITVTATAEDSGAIQALADTITRIGSPQSGWATVNNPDAASVGSPVEQDSQLRARQQVSTAISAVSPLDTLVGTVAGVEGVSRTKGYENDTGAVDANGIPAHSICIVVEGGESAEIAEAIFLKKTLGTGTYGDVDEEVTDAGGNVHTIYFYRVSEVEISVRITIASLAGYSAIVGESIKEAIADYITALDIGEDVVHTKLIAAASLWGTSEGETFTITSLELGRNGDSPLLEENVDIDFNEAAVCSVGTSPEDVELVVT